MTLRPPLATGSAVDVTRGIARSLLGQRHVDASQFGRLARALQRRVAAELGQFLHRRAAGYLQRRPDRPRRDAVHADAARCQLLRQRIDIVSRRRLGLGIVVQVLGRIHRLLGRRADDHRAGLQVRQRRLDDPERCVDVGLHRPVELFGRDVLDRLVRLLTAGVADDDVEAAELTHRIGHQALAERFLAQVAGDGDALRR